MGRQLIIVLIALLCACTEKKNSHTLSPRALNDSVFANIRTCLKSGGDAELTWNSTRPENHSNEDGEIAISTFCLASENDPLLIQRFLDSFPAIKSGEPEVRLARVSSYSAVIIICSDDTLSMSWDPAHGQIHINQKHYEIDFDQLYMRLERLKTSVN